MAAGVQDRIAIFRERKTNGQKLEQAPIFMPFSFQGETCFQEVSEPIGATEIPKRNAGEKELELEKWQCLTPSSSELSLSEHDLRIKTPTKSPPKIRVNLELDDVEFPENFVFSTPSSPRTPKPRSERSEIDGIILKKARQNSKGTLGSWKEIVDVMSRPLSPQWLSINSAPPVSTSSQEALLDLVHTLLDTRP